MPMVDKTVLCTAHHILLCFPENESVVVERPTCRSGLPLMLKTKLARQALKRRNVVYSSCQPFRTMGDLTVCPRKPIFPISMQAEAFIRMEREGR